VTSTAAWAIAALAALGLGAGALGKRRWRIEADHHLARTSAAVAQRLDQNDALLDGLAALINLGHDPAEPQWRAYVRDLLHRYPHLYMVSCQQRVDAAERADFERRTSERTGRAVRIRDFAIAGDRTWRLAPARAHYFPAIAMAPETIAAHDVVGYDSYGDPLFRAAIDEAQRSGRAVATAPFDLVEGGRAYACSRTLGGADGQATHVVSLLIRAEGLLAGMGLPAGAGIELRQPERSDALLGAVGSMQSPRRAKRRLHSQSQVFELHLALPRRRLADRALPWPPQGWRDLLRDRLFAVRVLRRERERGAQTLRDLAQAEQRADAVRARSLDDLGAGIAHELNQPLAAVVAYNQAALRLGGAAACPDLRTALQGSVEQSQRAAALIERLRSLVRRQPLQFRLLAMHEVVAAALRHEQAPLAQARITVRCKTPPSPLWVTGDALLLDQLLRNLLANAQHAFDGMDGAQGQCCIDITIEANGANCRTVVADNGPGIAATQRERLFHPFQSTKPGGLGLGLVVCASIAKAHGGSVALEASDTNTNAGARFVLALPLAPSPP
jgi:signal transduction histidine kinase